MGIALLLHQKEGRFPQTCTRLSSRESWTERDVYPMPRIEQILEQLHGKVLFTTLDIRDGYNNICVRPQDQWKLAFKLPEGTYAPQVMFFGMTNAPAVFQRTMDRIFAVLKNKYVTFWPKRLLARAISSLTTMRALDFPISIH